MSQFFDAYQKWPPQNQMIFAIAVMIVGAIMLFIIGWWLTYFLREMVYYIAVWIRGWPKDEAPVVCTPGINSNDMAAVRTFLDEVRRRSILVGPSIEQSTTSSLPGVGPDWQEETRRQLEKQEYQARLRS